MNEIMQTALEAGVELLAAVLAIAVPLFLAWVRKRLNAVFDRIEEKTDLEIEAAHRQTLNEAIATSVKKVAGLDGASTAEREEATAAAREYVKRSSPRAVVKINATDDILNDKITAAASELRAK